MLLLDELKIFAKNSNDKNTWHPFRKKIKQFLHSQNWIVPDKNQDFISTLDHLQEQLGSWHDLMAIQESLLSKQLYLSEDP
ncbi:CHAD domain-containing protein, partial [Acinetobacter baumannii]